MFESLPAEEEVVVVDVGGAFRLWKQTVTGLSDISTSESWPSTDDLEASERTIFSEEEEEEEEEEATETSPEMTEK